MYVIVTMKIWHGLHTVAYKEGAGHRAYVPGSICAHELICFCEPFKRKRGCPHVHCLSLTLKCDGKDSHINLLPQADTPRQR